MSKQDILMVGVGGQGIILASDILGEAALKTGLDVKKTDTLGMAQRGGSVTSHLRIGDKIWAPLISPGEADILLAFEKLEASRWVNYVKEDGIAIINDLIIPPLSISLGTHKYPDDAEIIDSFKQRKLKMHIVKGSETVKEMGDSRMLNVFMLGVLSSIMPINIDYAVWRQCFAEYLPAKIIDVNIHAFDKGREVGPRVNI